MNKFLCLGLAMIQGCVAYAATPGIGAFNSNQFGTNSNRIVVKDGASITNPVVSGVFTVTTNVPATATFESGADQTQTGFIFDTSTNHTSGNLFEIKNQGTNIFVVPWDGITTTPGLIITNITVENNITVKGNSTLNITTANSTTVSNSTTLLGTATLNGNGIATYAGITNVLTFALSDMTTALTTGTNKNYWYAPAAGMTIKWVRATLATTSSSGNPVFDINEAGTSILSTKITVEAGEWDSLDATSQPVISDAAIASKAKVDFDIDVAGTAAAGAQIQIGFTVP